MATAPAGIAWSITCTPHALPGAILLEVTGPSRAVIKIWRSGVTGGPTSVRNVTALDASGHYQIVDAEAPFGAPVVYTVEYQGNDVVNSTPIALDDPHPRNPVLLRSVIRPHVQWEFTRLVDQTNIEYRTRTTTYAVIGRPDPIPVADMRQMQSSTLIFYTETLDAADRLLELFKEGNTVLMRTPCRAKVRDMIFVPLDVRESHYKLGRLIEVEAQSVAWPHGETELPPPLEWTYDDLAKNHTAPSYGGLPPKRDEYLDLVGTPMP